MSRPSGARLPLSLLHLAAVLEERHSWRILDGNLGPILDPALRALGESPHALVGVTVMPGPQVATAIEISAAVRAAFPSVPIAWGGYFPTLYPDAAINAPYVDYLVRGQGEETLLELLARLPAADTPSALDSAHDSIAIRDVAGLTWKSHGRAIHNPERALVHPDSLPPLPYERLGDLGDYLRPTFMGARTAVYQAALGCRFKCDFCGVVSMWNGKTLLDAPVRLEASLGMLRDRWGADGVQFYDHNFFDREESSVPVLEVLGNLRMPWWCYARADTLARFSISTWEAIRRSRLRMAYIGAEAASDDVLSRMRKGSRIDHTLEVAARCREYGVIPEFSFVLGGPEDPEGEIEKTFAFIRKIKTLNPDSEIILYFYSPTPQVDRAALRKDPGVAHLPILRTYGPSGPALPTTPEEWTEPRWVSWVCHQDAPWLSPRTRKRVMDFARVLACRFPTAQDHRTPAWGKTVLRNLARWRYATGTYRRPLELQIGQRLFGLHDPKTESI
ncbi:MAG: B12-binding domain-containing radical SAM protein [Myxococcota bacterium]|nr:B12-binding domain-containing radical SAM protein [Myxococcota bacterium]